LSGDGRANPLSGLVVSMTTEKTEAIVIRQADFSETSRVVRFFTRDFGQISAMAKGARRLKGPFEAALDLLARCRVVFISKSTGSLDLLTEAQLIQRFTPHGQDLASLYGGYYVAELLGSLTESHDPHQVLYDETVEALNHLSEDDCLTQTVVRFELAVLREIGQLPTFDICVGCGGPIKNQGPFGFWVSQGGLACPKCQKQEYQHHPIQPGTVAVLRRLANRSDAAAVRLVIAPDQMKEIRHIMTASISHVLGRRPKLLHYLKF